MSRSGLSPASAAVVFLVMLQLPAHAQEPPRVRLLPAGTCLEQSTFVLDRTGAEEFLVCLRERKLLRDELAKCSVPVVVQTPPPIQVGLPWWVIPLSGAGGVLAGILAGFLL